MELYFLFLFFVFGIILLFKFLVLIGNKIGDAGLRALSVVLQLSPSLSFCAFDGIENFISKFKFFFIEHGFKVLLAIIKKNYYFLYVGTKKPFLSHRVYLFI